MKIEVDVHRTLVDAGADANGPRQVPAWTLLGGRYVIWRQLNRFRWALSLRGKPELRVGIASHGAGDDLASAVQACVDNFVLRQQVCVDHGEKGLAIPGVRVPGVDPEVPPPDAVVKHCRECAWQGFLGPFQVLCPSCQSPRLSAGPRETEEGTT